MSNKLVLQRITRTDNRILSDMSVHYSQPKGFVGRNICYAVLFDDVYYGAIVAGSATRFLPGRNEFLKKFEGWYGLNNIINNIFYHVEPKNGKYPIRNFTQKVLISFMKQAKKDWQNFYGDHVLAFETLVELPRTGELYKRSGFVETGITKGFTCKRTAGFGTDSWTGKRVWDTENLRPKRVLMRLALNV